MTLQIPPRMILPRKTPISFHVMVKPLGPVCNLNCAYCYYLNKRRLYPDSSFRMRDNVLKLFSKQYIEAQGVSEVTFGWQGGEPLLIGLDFFRRAVHLQKRYRPPGMRIVNAFQTNGTLLDGEWCTFFREHDFLVGLSLDGPRRLHNIYRVDCLSQPTFDRVMAGLELLKAYKIEFNILACVHAGNVNHPLEVYRFLRDEVGASFIQFIPIVESDMNTGLQERNSVTPRSVKPQQYGEFLVAIFDQWIIQDVTDVSVQIFDAALSACLGQPPGLCIFDRQCGRALVLEHNGDLYSCDHFVEPRHWLGNIRETPLVKLVGSAQQIRFGQAKEEKLPSSCRACDVLFMCHGGCPKNRLLETADSRALNYLCQDYKAFFTHIERPMRMLALALKMDKPISVVMDIMKEELQ